MNLFLKRGLNEKIVNRLEKRLAAVDGGLDAGLDPKSLKIQCIKGMPCGPFSLWSK